MFTGREYDSETGLYYYRARYYSPTLGRFLQRDPVGYLDDINIYRYCKNNPINFIDPYGLGAKDSTDELVNPTGPDTTPKSPKAQRDEKVTGWWPKQLDLVVPGYRNYGGPSRSGPGRPEDMMDEVFRRHDLGYRRRDLEQADLRLLYDLSNLPNNPREWGEGVNPLYASTYRKGAYIVFATRLVIIYIGRDVGKGLKNLGKAIQNTFNK